MIWWIRLVIGAFYEDDTASRVAVRVAMRVAVRVAASVAAGHCK